MEEQKRVDMEKSEVNNLGNSVGNAGESSIGNLVGNSVESSAGNSKSGSGENVVFIGSKPLVNYVRSVMLQFNKRNASEVIIKSRGKFISKAVDVAEVSKRSLEKNGVKTKGIKISSETFEKEGKTTNISAMDIVLGI